MSDAVGLFFTRGWTLQELIAPKNVVFVDRNFGTIGTKESLRSVIFDITGIHEAVLKGQDPAELSIAQRMSWGRKATNHQSRRSCLLFAWSLQRTTANIIRRGRKRLPAASRGNHQVQQ
jgi:hypothetical protein